MIDKVVDLGGAAQRSELRAVCPREGVAAQPVRGRGAIPGAAPGHFAPSTLTDRVIFELPAVQRGNLAGRIGHKKV